jgi:hypothetical protein
MRTNTYPSGAPSVRRYSTKTGRWNRLALSRAHSRWTSRTSARTWSSSKYQRLEFQPIYSKLVMRVFDLYVNFLKYMYSTRFSGGRRLPQKTNRPLLLSPPSFVPMYHLSCHVRTDVSWRQADVRTQVTWRSWRSCGKYNSIKICLILFKFCASSSSQDPQKQGMSLTPLSSNFYSENFIWRKSLTRFSWKWYVRV